ncbi:uncharacterized protein [Euwallacea fornicatus]|uniref:uncharacterized protein n=1 Tax=Euwallacea fornicatus TaxID=995702 RepID=UPI00338E060F
MLFFVFFVSFSAATQHQNRLEDCARFYHQIPGNNYLDILTGMNMPYIDQVPLPNNLKALASGDYMSKMQNIMPSPVITTKVLSVQTKYVYVNPVCVKFNKKQKLCKQTNENSDKLITKQNFLKSNAEKRIESADVNIANDEGFEDRFTLKVSFDRLEPSEPTKEDDPPSGRAFSSTPGITPQKIKELLIEDRLDHLESILPDYHRRRSYETSTMYVTKTLTNRRSMATLVVKNCVPVGYDICPKGPKRRRHSKIARRPHKADETRFYFG